MRIVEGFSYYYYNCYYLNFIYSINKQLSHISVNIRFFYFYIYDIYKI